MLDRKAERAKAKATKAQKPGRKKAQRCSPAVRGTTSSARRRVVVASLIGTSLEWYDFFLYGLAATLVFNKLFFPQFDPVTGTLLAFATFAVGFVARPLGGLVFGHYGDRVGRKNVLAVTLLLMGTATFLIGVLPTYSVVGAVAPTLLVTLRFLQGVGLGGEWGGAVVMSLESGDPRRRGFNASWPQTGAPVGNLLAAAVLGVLTGMLSDSAFISWGWRIPFLLSGVLVALGIWIRLTFSSRRSSPSWKRVSPRRGYRWWKYCAATHPHCW